MAYRLPEILKHVFSGSLFCYRPDWADGMVGDGGGLPCLQEKLPTACGLPENPPDFQVAGFARLATLFRRCRIVFTAGLTFRPCPV